MGEQSTPLSSQLKVITNTQVTQQGVTTPVHRVYKKEGFYSWLYGNPTKSHLQKLSVSHRDHLFFYSTQHLLLSPNSLILLGTDPLFF